MPREDAAEREAIRKMYAKRGWPHVTIRYHTASATYGIVFHGKPGPFGLESVTLSRHTVQELVRPRGSANVPEESKRGRRRRRKRI